MRIHKWHFGLICGVLGVLALFGCGGGGGGISTVSGATGSATIQGSVPGTVFMRNSTQVSSGFRGFERDLIRERVRAGLENTRRKGKRPGRRPYFDIASLGTLGRLEIGG